MARFCTMWTDNWQDPVLYDDGPFVAEACGMSLSMYRVAVRGPRMPTQVRSGPVC